ncbi:hypothetical protein IMG5_000790 [Ichthyophthirius multifiliis]|uniref:Ion transport domain-containing protein n=1 Tax=Ichthyophthirius multifiliis TaxID=5932 RepID=G0QIW6_ICHMU|nr:hypothetical protein IMG5_000790 [Ichthyophthirius multifiliis]EGR34851.1 hypothetical protein IMG5_000790 [Ichthyophthirius multifiliis]|eukprot:XP_004040155.1 hypothetical protein IMG5_000790 [Ichthyophthirius multifiliis]
MKALFITLNRLDNSQKMNKATRHLQDAIYLRFLRHDIETSDYPFIIFLYHWQTNILWNDFLFIIAFIYPMLSFFEDQYESTLRQQLSTEYYEIVLLILFYFDVIIETIHKLFDKHHTFIETILKNRKYILKFTILTIILADVIYYISSFPFQSLRFGIYIRPFLVLFYSKELRRTFKSISQSLKEILQLFLFYLFMTLFFALIGWKFIGDLDGQSNFNNIFTASNILYILITFDGYPDCLMPAYQQSEYYLLYFMSYILLYLFIFIPIPVAVVFEAFRNQRSKLVIMDRIKQKEALLACFVCLDFNDNKSIDYNIFRQFMSQVYKNKKRYIKRIKSLYLHIDMNDSKSISLNEFFGLVDVLERNPNFHIPLFSDLKLWENFRAFINKKMAFKKIAKSTYFEVFMILILLANCIIIFVQSALTDQETIDKLEQWDWIFNYAYITEVIVKIIGLGIEKYFEDFWNIFDISMVLLSLFGSILNSVLDILRSAKSLRTTKLLRLTKLNRIFKVFRAIKTMKIINVISQGIDTLNQVKILIQRIFMCIPIISKLIPILLIIFYIYALIGVNIFNTKLNSYRLNSPYDQNNYIDFNNFGNAMLILFQVMIEANWGSFVYDYAYKFDNFTLSVFYFDSFHMIIQLVLISLIKGIVWEVFTVVDKTIKDIENREQIKIQAELNNYQNNLNQEVDNQENEEEQNQKEIKNNSQDNSMQKGIKEYQIILSNLDNVSNKNSIILDEGQLPESTNHTLQKQFTFHKQSTNCKFEEDDIFNNENESLQNHQQQAFENEQQQQEFQYQQQQNLYYSDLLNDIFYNQNNQEVILQNTFINNTQQDYYEDFIQLNNNKQFFIKQIYSEIEEINEFEEYQKQKELKNKNQQLINEKHEKQYQLEEGFQKSIPSIIQENNEKEQNNNIKETKQVQDIVYQENNKMKSYLNGPNIDEEIILRINEKKSNTNSKSKSKDELSNNYGEYSFDSNKSQEKEKKNRQDIIKIKNYEIQQLKQKIRPLKYFINSQNQNRQQKDVPDIDFTVDLIDSDDEQAIKNYTKQLQDDMLDDEQDNELKNQKISQEKNEYANLGKANLHQNYIMKKALLQDSNMEIIKKLEIDYFQDCYGTFFNVFHNVNVSPILRYEGFLLYNLSKLLRHKTIPNQVFFKLILSIEKSVSDVIFQKGSFMKFIFQDSAENWFCLKQKNNETQPCLLGNGPWNYYDKVFKKDKDIYISRDFFLKPKNRIMQQLLVQFYQSFKLCASCIDKKLRFLSLNPNHHILQQQYIYINKQIYQYIFI